MSDFYKFLKVNKLKRKQIAAFLDVSGPFITQICKGERSLPPEKLARIKESAYNWDVSMLVESQDSLQSETITNNALIDYLQKKIAELEQKIDNLNSEKAELLQENAVLKYENLMMTPRKGDAQDAEDSLSADAI